jgi:tetratricopeptide (TPR) repeat protein
MRPLPFRCPPLPALPLAALSLLLIFALLLASPPAAAQSFQPDLGLATELIDGGTAIPPVIPPDAPELTEYPLPPGQIQPLLTEAPGKPFRRNVEPPMGHYWWKYPVYGVVGFPRDLVDGVFGVLANVPVVSVAGYAVYEVVPTQVVMRDPRDWHRWDGNRNENNHGFYDGDHWGFFPSAHEWTFRYESPRIASADEAYNESLREELQQLNRQVERHNQSLEARKLDARSVSLRAVQAGDGVTATRRMVPYAMTYPLDTQGSLALLTTGLALAGSDGPSWGPALLWSRLADAQPGPLQQSEELMLATLKDRPERPLLHEAVIYAALLRQDDATALERAWNYLELNSADPRRKRILVEAALGAGRGPEAADAMKSLPTATLPAWERYVLQARLQMATGQVEAARAMLTRLQASTPENAYLNYYLGCAELLQAQDETRALGSYQAAFEHLEKAVLLATHPALRQRAGEALAFARSVLAEAGTRPELFTPSIESTPAAP